MGMKFKKENIFLLFMEGERIKYCSSQVCSQLQSIKALELSAVLQCLWWHSVVRAN